MMKQRANLTERREVLVLIEIYFASEKRINYLAQFNISRKI